MWKYFRLIYRIIVFLGMVILYLCVSSYGKITIKDIVKRRQHFAKTVQMLTRMALKLINITWKGINVPKDDESFLVVCNHLGYLDILTMSSIRPSLYITSVEMKNTPFLGLLTEMGGCLYVERRSRANLENEIVGIREALEQGLSVVLYPEGTSTNGDTVLPFKKSLFLAALGTDRKVLPAVINYRSVNGQPLSIYNRDNVFWYGDMTFVVATLRLFLVDEVTVDIEFLNPIPMESVEDRRTVAEAAHAQILAKFKVPLSQNAQ